MNDFALMTTGMFMSAVGLVAMHLADFLTAPGHAVDGATPSSREPGHWLHSR